MRERHKSALRQREANKLEKARADFWAKIDADINEAKSCKSEAKKDTEESRREQKLMEVELDWRLDSMLGGWRDLR